MREVRFALGYMPHRIWGNILQAQFLEREPGHEFYFQREYIQNDPETHAYRQLTPMQREIVKHVDAYSDRNLHKLYSKKGTAREFVENADASTIRTHIRPYIEKHLYRILEIARDNNILLFVKDKSNRNIFPEDFVTIEKKEANPHFSFHYSDQLTYSLILKHEHEILPLKEHPIDIVCNHPCILILANALYFVGEINGKKLKPFTSKDRVVIPPEMEHSYFSTFVRNTLRDFNAETQGFPVEDLQPEKEAHLVLETGLNNRPVWVLKFVYNGQTIYMDSPLRQFVNYVGGADVHAFERFQRDPEWEMHQVHLINESGLSSRDFKNFYLFNKLEGKIEQDLLEAVSYTNDTGEELRKAGIRIKQRLQKHYFLGNISLDFNSEEKEDWFDLQMKVTFGNVTIPFMALKHHILESIREYELPGGETAVLPAEWFKKYRPVFEFGRIKGDRILIHKQHFSMVQEEIRPFHADTLDRLHKLNEVELLPDYSIPEGLKAKLRHYQEEGYRWLCFLQQNSFGGCLADDMGLGKTLQAIAILVRSKEELGEHKTSLVVVPASLLHNWLSELRRFSPGLKLYSHVGAHRNKEQNSYSRYDVIVSTYHTVRQDIEGLSQFPFHYVILDESQMIKNSSSKLYHAISELWAEHRMVLTGTPIENSLTDLWSQINFVNPGLLGTLGSFKKSFVQPIEKKQDEEREAKLKELINPFILRRTKQEVARELPLLFEQVRYCNMTEDQRRVYEEEKSLARNAILENLEEVGMERSTILVLRALTRLRQIANHPALLEEFKGLPSGKFTEVYRDLESVIAEGHKVLIFSSFVKHLKLFRERLDVDRIPYAYLTGSSNQEQRKKAVREFQNHNNCPLFLISLKAGGVGLNLTAADYVFILDPWWNPAAELQALHRAHRIGQDKNVFVYRFISNGTIEEKIQHLQQKKKKLSETMIASNNPMKNLTESELIKLFS
ncbi:MAG: DEAD/DEAH box helicase [bacterium]